MKAETADAIGWLVRGAILLMCGAIAPVPVAVVAGTFVLVRIKGHWKFRGWFRISVMAAIGFALLSVFGMFGTVQCSSMLGNAVMASMMSLSVFWEGPVREPPKASRTTGRQEGYIDVEVIDRPLVKRLKSR